MNLQEIATNKRFFTKRGKRLQAELQNILMGYCRDNNFCISKDDERFIEEWGLSDIYKLWKMQYDAGVIK